jgi:hypothetical protein
MVQPQELVAMREFHERNDAMNVEVSVVGEVEVDVWLALAFKAASTR